MWPSRKRNLILQIQVTFFACLHMIFGGFRQPSYSLGFSWFFLSFVALVQVQQSGVHHFDTNKVMFYIFSYRGLQKVSYQYLHENYYCRQILLTVAFHHNSPSDIKHMPITYPLITKLSFQIDHPFEGDRQNWVLALLLVLGVGFPKTWKYISSLYLIWYLRVLHAVTLFS